MRRSIALCLVPLVSWLSQASVVVDYDPALEGRTEAVEVVEAIVGESYIVAKSELQGKGDTPTDPGPSGLSPRDVLNILRRQDCGVGNWYCPQFGRCCPTSHLCCSYGYCLPPQATCCPSGPCSAGQTCCGTRNCMPQGAACCDTGQWCPRGNECYRRSGQTDVICCTNSRCTAHIDENGRTSSASTRTTTRSTATTMRQYYYWTYSWTYYSWYWTYSAVIQASIVTSTRVTTTTVLSVRTTDVDAASSYFDSVSETLTLSTPAEATRLSSLAGVSTRPASGGSSDSQPTSPPTDNDMDDHSMKESHNGGGRISINGGPRFESKAQTLWSCLDRYTVSFLLAGSVTGLLSILL